MPLSPRPPRLFSRPLVRRSLKITTTEIVTTKLAMPKFATRSRRRGDSRTRIVSAKVKSGTATIWPIVADNGVIISRRTARNSSSTSTSKAAAAGVRAGGVSPARGGAHECENLSRCRRDVDPARIDHEIR